MKVWRGAFFVLAVAIGMCHQPALGLKCFVGKGNSSTILPATDEEINKHQEEKNAIFKIYTCGEANSELIEIDKMIKNVTDQIQSSFNGIVSKAGNVLSNVAGNERRRRDADGDDEDDEEKFACAKGIIAGTAFRSCVTKVSKIQLNCTSALGQLALCYCHDDYCNGTTGVNKAGFALILALVTALLFGK